MALRLNNAQHPQRLNRLAYWKRAQDSLGTSCSCDFMFGNRSESADAGWLVIDDITGCFVLAAVADSVMGTWDFS